MNQQRTGTLLVLTMAFLVTAPAGASILLPGTTVIPAPFSGSPGTLLATVTSPFTSVLGATDFSGVATEAVYHDSITGNLDFLYQFTNNGTSGLPIEESTHGSYAGFTTDVYDQLGGPAFGPFSGSGTVAPTDATRSPSGINVSFDFPIPNAVSPGTTTAIEMIKTNATNFGPGTLSFINQGTATLTDFFAPAAAVPEPGTLVLFTGSLAILNLLRRRRQD